MMRPPRSPTERMFPVLSKAIAERRSVREIVEGSGSPRDCIAIRFRGSTISEVLLHEVLKELLLKSPEVGSTLLRDSFFVGFRLVFLF